jgi:hypothetical protein
MKEKQSITCIDTILLLIYGCFVFLLNICPVVAQVKAVYTVINYKKYLMNADDTVNRKSKLCLLLNGYIVGYIIFYTLYRFYIFEATYFNNKESYWKRHFAQTIGGLIILKVWYEIIWHGYHWIYNNDTTIKKSLCGHLFFTIGTFGLFIPYRCVELLIKGWKTNAICRHIIQTFLGLIIFKIWFELFRFGLKWTKDNDISQNKKIMGHLFLTLATLGIYLPYKFICVVYQNCSSQILWKRHLAQTIGGLIVFKIWYELFRYGILWTYEQNDKCKQFLGHIFLTIGSLGTFIPFRIGELIVTNWFSEILWKRHVAQTIGGLVVFKIWYEIVRCGIIWSYMSDTEKKQICKSVLGHTLLSLGTGGLFIPYRIGELIINNWFSEVVWKRHLAQTIGGLIVFKIWYELFRYGILWTYEQNDKCKQFLGHIFLTIGSLGTFIPFRIVQLIVTNWFSEISWKRHLAQTIGGLIVFKIWYELFRYGILWVYCDTVKKTKFIAGHIFLIIASLGIYIPARIMQLVGEYWSSENKYKRHTAQTVGGLIIFKIWYELFRFGIKWVYKSSPDKVSYAHTDEIVPEKSVSFNELSNIADTHNSYNSIQTPIATITTTRLHFCVYILKQILGHVFLIIATCGLFIIFRIFELWTKAIIYGIYMSCQKENRTAKDINIGYTILTLFTLGTFLPYKFIELITTNWNSSNKWKKHTAQTIGGLFVFKIWYEIFMISYRAIYVESQLNCYKFLAKCGLFITTLGLYSFVMIYDAVISIAHYFAKICDDLKYPPYSIERKDAINRLAIFTCLIPIIHSNLTNQDLCIRMIGHSTIFIINLGFAIIVTFNIYVLNVTNLYKVIFLSGFCVFNYITYLVIASLKYNENVIRMAKKVLYCMVYLWWKIKHTCDILFHSILGVSIRVCNLCRQTFAHVRTRLSHIHATFYNHRLPRLHGQSILTPESTGYVRPIEYLPIITPVPQCLTWQEKMTKRFHSDIAIQKLKQKNLLYVINAVVGKLKWSFDNACQIHSNRNIIFWNQRYDNLDATLLLPAGYSLLHIREWIRSDIIPNVEMDMATYDTTKKSFNDHLENLNVIYKQITNIDLTTIDMINV